MSIIPIINIQKIEKKERSPQGFLQVHSIFYTIQGEGPFSGEPAVFVRLSGCNLQCPRCDTDYTSINTTMTVNAIIEDIINLLPNARNKHQPCPLVVITGGEPFRQDITKLIEKLIKSLFKVQIETNGTLPHGLIGYILDETTIVCSPKTDKIHPNIYQAAKAFKYVLSRDSLNLEDGLPILALDHTTYNMVARPRPGAAVYIQPLDTQDPIKNAANLQACVVSCMKFSYTLQLQTHKLIGLP